MTRLEAIRKILTHGMQPNRSYSQAEVIDMIDRAKELGFDLGPTSPLDGLTVVELNILTQKMEKES